jgi:hypothetical protein
MVIVVEEGPALHLLIPGVITGAVIGKYGSYVKTIQEKSQADCQFHRTERPDHTRLVVIRGTVDQCIRAQKLIMMKISEVSWDHFRLFVFFSSFFRRLVFSSFSSFFWLLTSPGA